MTSKAKKWLSATLAIIMMATIVGVYGFNLDAKDANASKTPNTHIWVFNGDENSITNSSSYSYLPGSNPPGDCDGSEILPCYLLLESDNESALEAFLMGKDDQQVIAGAAATKSN